jgi:type II secretory pathway pseudopilin PulG
MGLVRENGQWRLLSIGLVLLDLPSLEVEWNAEQIAANESAVLESLKLVTQAIETYRRTYTHLPESLDKLGPAPLAPTGKLPAKPSQEAAGLLDADLTAGKKDGYTFRYVILGASSLGAVAQFEVAASPAPYGEAGRRSFFRDASGTFHAADHRGAVGNSTDPKVD